MTAKQKKKTEEFPLRFAAVGGLEEIGRNMMLFEYRDEIVVIDVGLQFPEETTPGIDYIIPNVSYLEERKKNIRAVILTHAHYDHIGALPYLAEKLGNPLIYTTALTKEIVVKRQEEFPNAPKLQIEIVTGGSRVKISKYFEAEFFFVSHTVPDTTGVILKTPVGNVVHFADFKIDYDKDGNPLRMDELKRVGREKILALFLDSTNAEVPGHSVSEKTVEKNLEELFKKAPGRIIVATFASLITRIGEIIKIGDRLGRKVFINGFSMKVNVEIAKKLGYLKIEKGALLPIEEVGRHKDNKILILSTGAQGEPNARLMRIASGEDRYVRVKPGDAVIFSSSVIPGNERSVQILKDDFTRQGAKVYQSKHVDIHSSGHAPQEELKMIIKAVKPKFLVPIHGYYFMRATVRELAESVGMNPADVFLIDNGQICEIRPDKFAVSKETFPSFYVMVDGLGVGDVGEVVLRDRRLLAQEGMLVIIASIDRRSGRLIKSPDIISRGFIYLKENREFLNSIRSRIRGLIDRMPRHQEIDADYLKSLIRNQIGEFLYAKTKRRPMILPVVIEI